MSESSSLNAFIDCSIFIHRLDNNILKIKFIYPI